MTMDSDAIVDRRRMRRKLSVWRVIAVTALVIAVIAAIGWTTGMDTVLERHSDHVARLTVSGLITDNRKRLELIEKMAKSSAVKALVVTVDSPGGTTAGGEAIYNALRRFAEKKPVVAHMRTIATSAGYMVAISTDHVVARRNTLTGSIGVIFQFGEVSQLLDKIGIKFDEVKSAPLKAEPSPYHATSPEARQVLADLVAESYEWFVGLVAERRGLSDDVARTLADGRVYSGSRAKALKLIDAIGGERVAIAWLESEKGIKKGLPIRDWSIGTPGEGLGLSAMLQRKILQFFGLPSGLMGDSALESIVSERLKLDGLLSVWHAPGLRTSR